MLPGGAGGGEITGKDLEWMRNSGRIHNKSSRGESWSVRSFVFFGVAAKKEEAGTPIYSPTSQSTHCTITSR